MVILVAWCLRSLCRQVLYLCRPIIGGDAFRFVTELRLPIFKADAC
jgi:hypothetical protein